MSCLGRNGHDNSSSPPSSSSLLRFQDIIFGALNGDDALSKLAPRQPLSLLQEGEGEGGHAEGEGEGEECPICFLAYDALNWVECCRNKICTDCYCLLIKSGTNPSCPFCSHNKLSVSFSNDAQVKEKGKGTGEGKGSEAAAASFPHKLVNGDRDGDISTSSPQKSASPESGTGSGSASKYRNSHIPHSSVADRRALEQEIQTQRSMYFDDSSTARTRSASASANVYVGRSPGISSSSLASTSMRRSVPSSSSPSPRRGGNDSGVRGENFTSTGIGGMGRRPVHLDDDSDDNDSDDDGGEAANRTNAILMNGLRDLMGE